MKPGAAITRILLLVLITLPGVAAADEPSMPRDSIRNAAERVMQQHDYRSVRRRVLEQVPVEESSDDGFLLNMLSSIGRAIGDFLEWLFTGLFSPRNRVQQPTTPATPPAASGGGLDFSLAEFLLFVGLAALILLLVWIIAAIVRRSDARRKMDSSGLFDDEEELSDLSVPPGELAASTYESRAILMAREGNYRSAIRELLVGSMSWIERAGHIRYRKGLTNRDYVRAIWTQQDRRESYLETAIAFERIYFGRRPATADMFNGCLSSFQSSFREEEAAHKV